MKFSTLLCLSLSLTLISCQKNPSSPTETLSPPPSLQSHDFKEAQIKVDPNTGLKIITEEISETALTRLRQEAEMTTLRAFPVDPQFNTNLFTLEQSEYQDFVFLAPKVYAFSTTDGARVSILENEDGTVSIPFHVAMVSGLESKVSGTKTNELIQLPENYLVRNMDGLKSETLSRGRPKWALLPGCPKAFSIKVVDREFDVTPKDLAISDHCDLSKPFTLALRTSKSNARYILQKALYDNTVDLRADFQTMVPYMVSKVDVEFDKQRIYDELEIHLKARYQWVTAVEARQYLEKIMKQQVLRVDIRGDYTSQLEAAVDASLRVFFNEVPEKNRAELNCPSTQTCLTLNRDFRSSQHKLGFHYQRTANTLGSRIFRSTTRLQPLNDKSVIIGDASALVADQGATRPSLYNDGSSLETGLTVQEGDLLEITPQYLNVEKRQLAKAKVTKESKLVCVKTRLQQTCDDTPRPCVWRNTTPETSLCPRPPRCRAIQVCEQEEDQYIQTTEYSNGTSSMEKIESPVGQFQEIYEGLALKFTFTSQTATGSKNETILCPLKHFQREGDGGSLTVRIENTPECPIFDKQGRQNHPMLHIVNQISFPQTYKTGADVINWKGEVLSHHSLLVFKPQVGFGGILRIRGYRINSQLLH